MKTIRRTTRSTHGATLACTASALVAIVAFAAAISSLPGGGANVRAALLETRVGSAESTAVRAVAAAVAAVARELAGGERITAALPAEGFALAAAPAALPVRELNAFDVIRSRPLDERLIDLPPPVG